MIIFKALRYKNFLSSGNNFTEIQLNKDRTTLVVGHNGAGKSTMLDAISFGLFGKAHRNINKAQLINSINAKSCLVEVEFSVGGNQFKVCRGIKPNIFEIWKNGTMINQSSHSKEYQKILEQNILKLTHKSFHQVVVLGSSSFIPFMQLPGGHRREVIEDLLDINVFSKMNVILKERNVQLKDKLKQIDYNIDIVKTKIESQKKYIRDIAALTEENRKDYESRIHASQNLIDELQAENSELSLGLDADISEAEQRLQSLQDRKQSLMLRGQDRQSTIRDLEKRISFFEENEACPVCDQTISDGHKHEILLSTQTDRDRWKAEIKEIGTEGQGVESEISEQTSILSTLRDRVHKLTANSKEISKLQATISDYRSHIEKEISTDLTEARADLVKFEDDRSSALENKMKISEEFNYNSVIVEMLKDTGIKTKIIKQYLPVMNKLVNQYLQVLDFFVHFHLDESFQEVIRSRHRDEFTYDSFSEGEKQRIDLALLFTWRQVAKMKNSVATNLLLLDETFDSSLDHEGVENLLKILYTLGEDTNVFVISHKGEILDGKFNNKLEFVKEKNFSKMKSSVQANELVV
ncbi:AAA family ATPase [bacterium]|nr:AAA family ATPase [bacterium]